MKSPAATLFIICASMCPSVFGESAGAPGSLLQYTRDGRLERPDQFREWTFLTSGFDMSYSADRQMSHHAFDNVFVNPAAYRAFLATGTWPDQTVLVIENRAAEGRGSINKSGNYQGTNVVGLEVHVKDAARFAGGWAFFEFEGGRAAGAAATAGMIPRSSECYSCHAAHAAVDTTFVQFYPTLLPIAQAKGTFLERKDAGKGDLHER
jgi:Cytochrome P460